jgi:hypothetical protein
MNKVFGRTPMPVKRLWTVVLLVMMASWAGSVRNAAASTITVASFSWDVLFDDPGVPCDEADSECVPIPPSTFLSYSLTDLWDGPNPAPLLTNNSLTLPDVSLPFLDLVAGFPCASGLADSPCSFDQIALEGVPAFATATVSFLFDGQPITLAATLTEPNSVALLQFTPVPVTPVPEPGTLALTMLGAATLVRRRFLRR